MCGKKTCANKNNCKYSIIRNIFLLCLSVFYLFIFIFIFKFALPRRDSVDIKLFVMANFYPKLPKIEFDETVAVFQYP